MAVQVARMIESENLARAGPLIMLRTFTYLTGRRFRIISNSVPDCSPLACHQTLCGVAISSPSRIVLGARRRLAED